MSEGLVALLLLYIATSDRIKDTFLALYTWYARLIAYNEFIHPIRREKTECNKQGLKPARNLPNRVGEIRSGLRRVLFCHLETWLKEWPSREEHQEVESIVSHPRIIPASKRAQMGATMAY